MFLYIFKENVALNKPTWEYIPGLIKKETLAVITQWMVCTLTVELTASVQSTLAVITQQNGG